MTEQTVKVIEIDTRGQVCPSTLLVALNIINQHKEELQRGKVKLMVRTDNRDATTTIPATAENMGYEIEVLPRDGFYEIFISYPG